MQKKLYTNDRDIPYRNTKINPQKTKADIDAILSRWGIEDIAWTFAPEKNRVRLQFQLNEKFQDRQINPVISLEPPRIWNKRSRRNEESINWAVSLRVLHWYIKNTLAMSYAMQSEKTLAFLPHVATKNGETLKDSILPQIEHLQEFKALEAPPEAEI